MEYGATDRHTNESEVRIVTAEGTEAMATPTTGLLTTTKCQGCMFAPLGAVPAARAEAC